MKNFDLKKYLAEGKLHENEFGGMGLIVKGETSKDNDLIDQAVEESGFYGVYNSREDYWFFPEEGDQSTMDRLENELENIFIKKGANVSFEGQFNENLKLGENYKNKNKMKNFDLKKYLAENKLLKENLDGSQHHIDQINDDLMYGDFETEDDVDDFLNNIIAGIEEIRAMYKAKYV